MPIRTLEPFLESAPLDALKNTVIGIDVQHYLSTILSANIDPTFEAIGGFPISLKSKILSDVESFKKLGMKPIFVLPGLKTLSQFGYLEQSTLLPYEKHLQHLWETKKSNPNIDISFRNLDNPYLLRSILDELLIFFVDNDLEYLISPFSQYHQLFYMLKIGIINCMYSSNDSLLLKNLDNFILNIDFKSNTFHYLENKKVLHDLNLTFKQFRDISMCVGNSFQPIQLITSPNNSDFISLAQSTLNGTFNIYNSLSSSDKDDKLDKLIQSCTVLDYCPVLKVNGRVEQIFIEVNDSLLTQHSKSQDDSASIKNLTDKKIPKELHKIFGLHLPDEFFFYQSIGLNVFHIAESFLTLNYNERLPLDMTTDSIYEKIIFSNSSMKIKEIMLNLFTSCLHRYMQTRKLVLKTYFKGTELHDLDFKMIPAVYTKFNSLFARHTTARSFDLPYILSNLNDNYLEESTFKGGSTISSNHEIIATSLLRTLILYQFITESPFKLSKWGNALTKYFKKYNTSFESTLLLFLFFQRFPDLDLKVLSESQDLQFDTTTKENYDSLLLILISKFSTLFQIQNLKPSNYTGIVSRSLLHFNSIMNKLHNEVRDMVTINVLVILFDNKIDLDKYARDNNDWSLLATEIPFKSSIPNTLSGLIVSKTIQTFLHESKETFKSKIEENLSTFNVIVDDPVRESLKALKSVLNVCNIIEILAEDGLVKERVINTFSDIKSTLNDIIALY